MFKQYYSQLYRREQPLSSRRIYELLFSNLSRPDLTDIQRETLNKPITEQEDRSALASLRSGKAPDPDGLGCHTNLLQLNLLIDLNLIH